MQQEDIQQKRREITTTKKLAFIQDRKMTK